MDTRGFLLPAQGEKAVNIRRYLGKAYFRGSPYALRKSAAPHWIKTDGGRATRAVSSGVWLHAGVFQLASIFMGEGGRMT
jgi:hypothetical protein